MRKLILPAAALFVFLTAVPAMASPQVFCRQGWHRVARHGVYVCVRNHHH